ncbi:MGDG synthase family glycosyltransferase [Desulfosporosinus nitroreducens]|uniref:UDP-N-acetylglucosamine--LPS N-acetylglucosamine transferase n=1 Tax=Desulfosporosinus nitroreducens TaxID=2018668 RepID=A0ABT8QJ59_9FIRM|nr:glycosyltransferase [Desulfosporosinus nitroreducens]MDO0821347.1 UDP-N-acetylglucosamine--LPS N-acetylglucosamine transferase [Desulfosporosinus nitroreducens]
MRQLRVLVFSAGFGNGHFRAAEAVIEGIQIKVPSAKIMHLDFGDFLSKRFNTMAKNVYMEMIKYTPKLWGKFYDKTAKFHPNSMIQRFLKQLGRKDFVSYIQAFAPDLIVCTYPTVSSILAQLRLEQILQVPVITVITDYTVHSHWVHPGVDRYMVACEEVKESLVSWGIRERSILVTGIPVSPKFELQMDREHIITELGLNPDVPIYLVMGGAYESLKSTKRICHRLANSLVPVQSIIVCGKNDKLYDSLGEVIQQSPNPMMRLRYVHNIEELMSISTLIITKAGGLTVSEALTKHLPLVIYKAIPGQEEANADFLLRLGAGNVANTEQDLFHLLKRYLTNPKEIVEMREKAASSLKGQSAVRTAEAIFELLLDAKKDLIIC